MRSMSSLPRPRSRTALLAAKAIEQSARSKVGLRAACALALVLSTSCNGGGHSTPTPDPSPTHAPGNARSAAQVEWVKIPAGKDPSNFVVSEMARALGDKKKLVLFVGASWCEPCRHFHEAAESHALDAAFGDVRFIDLDHDEDAAALSALWCDSKLIPLFALPSTDGRCSDRRVEGGIKGDGAVAYLAPRLRTLLGP